VRERNAKTAQTAGASCRGCEFFISLNITVQEINYAADGTANIRFIVHDLNSTPIQEATVTVSGSDIGYLTGPDGTVLIRNVDSGDYLALARKTGYTQDNTTFEVRFEIKREPAEVPEQPEIREEAAQVFSVPWCPILAIIAVLVLFYILWKRSRKKGEADEGQLKAPASGQKTQ